MNLQDQTPQRFQRLPYKVHLITAKTPEDLFKVIPALRGFFQKAADYNKSSDTIGKGRVHSTLPDWDKREHRFAMLIKYIIFCFDPESDLLDEFPDNLRERKEAAAREAGFKRQENGLWSDWMEAVFTNKDTDVLNLILHFLKSRKNDVWRELVLLDQELDNIYYIRANEPDRALKEDLDKKAKQKIEAKAIFTKQFFDQQAELKEVSEEILYPISAENVFKILKIPKEQFELRQIADVPKTTGLQQTED